MHAQGLAMHPHGLAMHAQAFAMPPQGVAMQPQGLAMPPHGLRMHVHGVTMHAHGLEMHRFPAGTMAGRAKSRLGLRGARNYRPCLPGAYLDEKFLHEGPREMSRPHHKSSG